MRRSSKKRGAAGYVSVVLVLSTGLLLTTLMVFAYRSSIASQAIQAQVQLRYDYMEKEEEILRAVVALTPNRAIRAMQDGSNSGPAARNPLTWKSIFAESVTLANARNSIPGEVLGTLGAAGAILSNTGDGTAVAESDLSLLVGNLHGSADPDELVTPGLNRTLGTGFPPALSSSNGDVIGRDFAHPIISNSKIHGQHAEGRVGLPVTSYPRFNLLHYPEIGFGYAQPGELFVAKRNWWAFSLDAGKRERHLTGVVQKRRDFVLSIYEIPSQLAISAEAFMNLGRHASGAMWQNTTIQGGVFAGRAVVEGETGLDSLSSRRGMELAADASIGGRTFEGSPFAPGVRESYLLTEGDFFPVSLASDSGRSAFIPINRGAEFFDRFALPVERQTLSDTGWNEYSIGALQAAMRVDVTAVEGGVGSMPQQLRFSYLDGGGSRRDMTIALRGAMSSLPEGYTKVVDEGQSFHFTQPVDVAYGAPGGFVFLSNVSGTIQFSSSTFDDPAPGAVKSGYWRPRAPCGVTETSSGRICMTFFPERLPAFLAAIGAADVSINHSVVMNVDYTTTGLNNPAARPNLPPTSMDYGVVLEECANLTPFKKGFSLVTNLRLFIGDDFNIKQATAPEGYPEGEAFFPPCSIFSPEKRYGVNDDPVAVVLSGQVGSLARGHKVNVTDADPAVVRPLESRGMSNEEIDAGRITVNLRPIKHPAELPPITMMNWLVVLEEKRGEFD
jgi:hypothetical protein